MDTFTPQYMTALGLNETLKIDGFSYIYDPTYGAWEGEPGDWLTASEIHELILEGRHRVLPWTAEVAR